MPALATGLGSLNGWEPNIRANASACCVIWRAAAGAAFAKRTTPNGEGKAACDASCVYQARSRNRSRPAPSTFLGDTSPRIICGTDLSSTGSLAKGRGLPGGEKAMPAISSPASDAMSSGKNIWSSRFVNSRTVSRFSVARVGPHPGRWGSRSGIRESHILRNSRPSGSAPTRRWAKSRLAFRRSRARLSAATKSCSSTIWAGSGGNRLATTSLPIAIRVF